MFLSSLLSFVSRVGVEICSVDLTVPTLRPFALCGYSKYSVIINQNKLIILCFPGLWYYRWHISESAPHAIPFAVFAGKSYRKHLSVFSYGRCGILLTSLTRKYSSTILFSCSGCFSLIKSRDHSLSSHLPFMLTTELHASVTEISLKLVTCAPCACQVSLWILKGLIPYIQVNCSNESPFFSSPVFCNFSPICSTCE